MVTERAIMPQVPTEVFRFELGKILSSVNEICVVVMYDVIMPIFRMRINTGISFSSNASLLAYESK